MCRARNRPRSPWGANNNNRIIENKKVSQESFSQEVLREQETKCSLENCVVWNVTRCDLLHLLRKKDLSCKSRLQSATSDIVGYIRLYSADYRWNRYLLLSTESTSSKYTTHGASRLNVVEEIDGMGEGIKGGEVSGERRRQRKYAGEGRDMERTKKGGRQC